VTVTRGTDIHMESHVTNGIWPLFATVFSRDIMLGTKYEKI
jgi:hypothetical protein